MKSCTMSIRGLDDHVHAIEVKGPSLFAIAEQAIRECSRLWWYPGGDVLIEIRSGEEVWRVRTESVRQWQAKESRRDMPLKRRLKFT